MGYQEDGYNREKVKEIVERYTMRMKGHSISEVSVSRTMFQMVTEASEHGLHMPNRVALVGKSLITMEGIGMEIYPDFQVDGAYRETLVEVLFKNNRPENLVSRLGSDVIRNKEMFEKAPSAIRRALEPREQEITVQTGKESGEHVVPAALILGSTLLLYQVLPPGAMAAAAVAMLGAAVYFLR
jgi:predicted unusual protein kinase regulating ubiquinone biosynthesis (AarF/ABC1/UbiB family)